MGIYNRDYIRETPPPASFGAGGTVWKRLIIATAIVFVLQMVFTRPPTRAELREKIKPEFREQFDQWTDEEIAKLPLDRGKISVVEKWLALTPDDVLYRGQVWRLVTYAFLHGRNNLLHIIFNMLFLWWFGKTLETMYGSREFLCFYLCAAFVSGLAFLALGLAVGRMNPAIGASGSIMAIIMLYAMWYPRQRLYVYGIIPVEIRFMVAAYVLFDLYPVITELSGADVDGDGVAHSAHLGGLAFGFLYKKFNLRLAGFFSRLKMPRANQMSRARRKIKIFQPDPEERSGGLEQEVDAILEKIHKQGEASLTDQERKTLENASRKYKNR